MYPAADNAEAWLAAAWLSFSGVAGWRPNRAAAVATTPLRSMPSQKRLCLLSDVTVENACPQSLHLICWRQSACILLCRHRFENCVYAFRHTSHWNGFTELWMCWCCFRPLDVANVLLHSWHVCERAPTCVDRMWRCRLLGSVKIFSQCSHGKCLSSSMPVVDSSPCVAREQFRLNMYNNVTSTTSYIKQQQTSWLRDNMSSIDD